MLGKRLETIEILGERGDVKEYVSDGTPSLVIVFTSTCVFCEETASRWRDLKERLPNVVFVAVSAEGADVGKQWLARHKLDVDRLIVPSPGQLTQKWGASHVPLTIATDHAGSVVRVQYGVLRDADLTSFAEALGFGTSRSARAMNPSKGGHDDS
jgi:hypothetical protein